MILNILAVEVVITLCLLSIAMKQQLLFFSGAHSSSIKYQILFEMEIRFFHRKPHLHKMTFTMFIICLAKIIFFIKFQVNVLKIVHDSENLYTVRFWERSQHSKLSI